MHQSPQNPNLELIEKFYNHKKALITASKNSLECQLYIQTLRQMYKELKNNEHVGTDSDTLDLIRNVCSEVDTVKKLLTTSLMAAYEAKGQCDYYQAILAEKNIQVVGY